MVNSSHSCLVTYTNTVVTKLYDGGWIWSGFVIGGYEYESVCINNICCHCRFI